MTQRIEVSEAGAARTVTDERSRVFLQPFLGRRRSIAEAAREVGCTTEQMAYRVGRFVEQGLLREVESRSRAGRAVVVYEGPHEIRVPSHLLPEADVTAIFDVMDQQGRKAFLSAIAHLAVAHGRLAWCIRLARHDADVMLDMVPAQGDWQPGLAAAPPVVFNWAPLALTDTEARDLQARLLDVLDTTAVNTHRPTHLLGLFLTPLDATT